MKKIIILCLIAAFTLIFAASPAMAAAKDASGYSYRPYIRCRGTRCFYDYVYSPPSAPASSAAPTASPSATAAPQEIQAPSSSASSHSQAEQQMIALINQERTAAGLPALTADSRLRSGALAHSQDMAANNFFSHTSPTKGSFSKRIKTLGISASAENIALYGSITKAHAALMASSGHRANIMNAAYTRVGIAVVYSQARHGYYITQWFGR